MRSAAATPIEPARKSNSQATTATRRPNTRPSPVSTDSSRPVAASRRGQLACVGRRLGDDQQRCASQLTEGPLVQHGVAQLKGADPAHRTRLIGRGAP